MWVGCFLFFRLTLVISLQQSKLSFQKKGTGWEIPPFSSNSENIKIWNLGDGLISMSESHRAVLKCQATDILKIRFIEQLKVALNIC